MSNLLERARRRAGGSSNHPLDTLHVVLAALETEDDQDQIWLVIRDYTAPAQRQRWITRIEAELEKKPPESKDGKTVRLIEAEQVWKNLASGQGGNAPDTVILRTVLEQDSATRAALNDDPTRETLIEQLREQRRTTGAPNFAASGTTTKAQELAKEVAAKLCRRVEPLRDLPYRALTSNGTTTFLNRLAKGAEDQFDVLVCVGPDGSHIDILQHVIADHLAFRDSFVMHQAPLNAFGELVRLDVRELLGAKRDEATLDMALTFKAAKVLARERKEKAAILLVDHVEAIPQSGDDADKLKTQIGLRDQALFFGIYHAPDDKDHSEAATLKQPSIRVLPIHAYSPEDTVSLIEEFYLRHVWPKRGFTFAPNAFKDLIVLEEGAWIDKRRVMLPGMAVRIAEDTMDTIEEGAASVRTTASGALKALKALKQDKRPTVETRARFADVLGRAERAIKPLAARRKSSRWRRAWTAMFGSKEGDSASVHSARAVTAAHLLAQLLCVNNSEFVYPPFPPEGA